jgi:hypothetical protein
MVQALSRRSDRCPLPITVEDRSAIQPTHIRHGSLTAAVLPILFTLASCMSKPPPENAEMAFIETGDGAAVSPGDRVTAQLTEAVAILVEKS